MPPFDVPYTEKLEVGYKWFDGENKEPLSRSLPAPVWLRSRQAGLRLYPAASLVKAWGCRIALPGCEAVESRLQQRRGRSEARHPEAVDCGCQIKQPPSGSLAQNTQDPSDPQAASGGNTSRCFLVEQDNVGQRGLKKKLGQEVDLTDQNEIADGRGVRDGDHCWEVSRIAAISRSKSSIV